MNHKALISAFVVVLLAGVMLVGVPTTEAANGQAKGLYGFPGNSLYGRSHNPHFMYKWGNEEFESMDELLEYIREYMETWRKLHKKSWQWEYQKADVNVITRSATEIDEDSALLRGKLELDDDEEAEVWFEYGTRLSSLSEDTGKLTRDDEDNEEFSIRISGLEDSTRYYFRAVAEDKDNELDRGTIMSFVTKGDGADDEDGDPEVSTLSAHDITDDEATIRGTVDMNDFDDGLVFFVYGLDEDDVENTEDKDEYADIDEDGDNLQVLKMSNAFDGNGTWEYDFEGLDDDTTYYFRIGLEFEDEDGDTELIFGTVKSFTTGESDTDNDGDEPEISTLSAQDITDDEATIRGKVDMNDFDDGLVFFIYGTDEDAVEDVEDEDEYDDIDEDGDNLQVLKMNGSFDGYGTWIYDFEDLDNDMTYYYRIGLEYEDEDDDTVLIFGDVKEFTTED